MASPEFRRSREGLGYSFAAFEEVELNDLLTVGGVGETKAEYLGIILGLLHAVSGAEIARLCLDHRESNVGTVPQEVVGAFPATTARLATNEDDTAIGESALFMDGVRRGDPSGSLKARGNIHTTGVGLGVHWASVFRCSKAFSLDRFAIHTQRSEPSPRQSGAFHHQRP